MKEVGRGVSSMFHDLDMMMINYELAHIFIWEKTATILLFIYAALTFLFEFSTY